MNNEKRFSLLRFPQAKEVLKSTPLVRSEAGVVLDQLRKLMESLEPTVRPEPKEKQRGAQIHSLALGKKYREYASAALELSRASERVERLEAQLRSDLKNVRLTSEVRQALQKLKDETQHAREALKGSMPEPDGVA